MFLPTTSGWKFFWKMPWNTTPSAAPPEPFMATSTAPKATAIQVRDLNEALKQQSIGTTFPDSVPVAEHAERGKKVRLGWVNQMLADGELPEVGGMSELSPEIIDRLIVAAKAGKVPAGW